METTKFKPRTFERRIDDLARELIGEKGRSWWPSKFDGGDWFVPAADVFNRKRDLVMRVNIPGIDPKKDVEVRLGNGRLIVRGKRISSEKEYLRRESSYGRFGRSVPIPDETTEKDVTAIYRAGILEVVVRGAAIDRQEIQAGKKAEKNLAQGKEGAA